jgi:hypothetical protein
MIANPMVTNAKITAKTPALNELTSHAYSAANSEEEKTGEAEKILHHLCYVKPAFGALLTDVTHACLS